MKLRKIINENIIINFINLTYQIFFSSFAGLATLIEMIEITIHLREFISQQRRKL